MDVTIIGTGNMARGIGSRVLAGGHELAVGGRRSESAEEVVADLGGGSVASEAGGDVVVIAVYYDDARQAADEHREQLSGKVAVDITNPVNETFDGRALGQGLQHHLREHPRGGRGGRSAARRADRR